MKVLTQQEADELIALEKEYKDGFPLQFPNLGGRLNFKVFAKASSEEFFIDVSRGRVKLSKLTFQNRARKTIVLVRLDIDASPHRNPDGEELGGSHIHIYKEGYDDTYALPLPECFVKCQDAVEYLDEFLSWCNVILKPTIEKGLFA